MRSSIFCITIFALFYGHLHAIPVGPKPSWKACEKHYEALYNLRILPKHLENVWEGYSFIGMLSGDPLYEVYKTEIKPFAERYNTIIRSSHVSSWDSLEYFYQFREKIHVGRRLAHFGLEQALFNNEFRTRDIPPIGEATRQQYNQRAEKRHQLLLNNLDIIQDKSLSFFSDLYSCGCIKRRTSHIIYDHGLVELALGNIQESFELANELIEKHAKESSYRAIDFSKANCCYNLGVTYGEALNYSKAIEYLSLAIQNDPNNKQAHLERAIAYFETNQIEQACADFKYIDTSLFDLPKSTEHIQFGQGFVVGAPQGLADGFQELPSSLWYSLRGAGQLLWAGVSDPLAVPEKMIQATTQLVEYLKTQNLEQISEKLAPEVAELVKNWDVYDSITRGQKSGYVLGKYGVGVFISCGTARAVSAYRELKRTNALCSIKTMASSQTEKKAICELSQKASEARTAGFAKVQYSVGKEGKHIEGNTHYESDKNRSIMVHSKMEALFEKHAGKGTPDGSALPGTGGYKEIVDAKEFIGFHVDKDTGVRTPTSHLKIHYDKDGWGHMVPYLPRKEK